MLLIMRVELEQFRFNVQMTKQSGAGMTIEVRTKLANSARDKLRAAQDRVASVCAARMSRHGNVRQVPDWLKDKFVKPAKAILDDWEALERSVRNDTFYQPVSHEELTQIVKGLNFCVYFSHGYFCIPITHFDVAHTGHFYKCPNGHTFVITEVSFLFRRRFVTTALD